MRTIKFRYWTGTEMIPLNAVPVGMLNKYDDPVMQFTGRQDHHNNDVYEGDIIAPKVMGDANIDHYRMENGKAIPIPMEIKWKYEGFVMPIDIGAWEVIGNIYKNPELLT
jgi:hypothetical protein